MQHESFLNSPAIFVLGIPGAEQHAIVDSLIDVGLVRGGDVFWLGDGPSVGNGLPIDALQSVCAARIVSDSRTVFVIEIGTLKDYELVRNVIEQVERDSFIVVMDTWTEDVLSSIEDDEIRLQAQQVAAEIEEGGPRYWGIPSSLSSVVVRAIEGEDEW